MSEVSKILASNIQKYRKLKGLTQESLALKLGVTFQAVSKWENGKSSPDVLLLPLIADEFSCSIDDLFSYKSQNTQTAKPEYEFKQIKGQIGDDENAEKFLSIIAMDGATDMSDEKIKKLIGHIYHGMNNQEN